MTGVKSTIMFSSFPFYYLFIFVYLNAFDVCECIFELCKVPLQSNRFCFFGEEAEVCLYI